jgi:hypothetical protein
MPSLADVFRTLNDMKSEGIVHEYAIGGGMAALFYAEAMRTYDIDVFALIPPQPGPIIRLTEIYEWAGKHGFKAKQEHILIHNVPVQFLAANQGLEAEAVARAETFDYEGVSVRVIRPEYQVVLSVLVGGAKRRERARLLFEAGVVDQQALNQILEQHNLADEWHRKWQVP